jgi:hypothetical protein
MTSLAPLAVVGRPPLALREAALPLRVEHAECGLMTRAYRGSQNLMTVVAFVLTGLEKILKITVM